jgi:hypothetical protein
LRGAVDQRGLLGEQHPRVILLHAPGLHQRHQAYHQDRGDAGSERDFSLDAEWLHIILDVCDGWIDSPINGLPWQERKSQRAQRCARSARP